MQPGRDFVLLASAAGHWGRGSGCHGPAAAPVLCSLLADTYFSWKKTWVGFWTAVCYYVQYRYFFWQGFFHLVCMKVETQDTFGSANALLWSSKNDLMVARCSSLLIFIPQFPGIRTMIAVYHWIWKLLQFTYFILAFDVGKTSGNSVSVLGSVDK